MRVRCAHGLKARQAAMSLHRLGSMAPGDRSAMLKSWISHVPHVTLLSLTSDSLPGLNWLVMGVGLASVGGLASILVTRALREIRSQTEASAAEHGDGSSSPIDGFAKAPCSGASRTARSSLKYDLSAHASATPSLETAAPSRSRFKFNFFGTKAATQAAGGDQQAPDGESDEEDAEWELMDASWAEEREGKSPAVADLTASTVFVDDDDR